MDRPEYDLKGIGLHRDQVDLLCCLRRLRRPRNGESATLLSAGLLFAVALALALVLIAARTAL